MYRRIFARARTGMPLPSGVRRPSTRPAALLRAGSKFRTPSRARAALVPLISRVRSPTRFSRSRLGRLASSSSMFGIGAMVQCPGSLRRHPCQGERAPRCYATLWDMTRSDYARGASNDEFGPAEVLQMSHVCRKDAAPCRNPVTLTLRRRAVCVRSGSLGLSRCGIRRQSDR